MNEQNIEAKVAAYEAGMELAKENPHKNSHNVGVAASDYAEISSGFYPEQDDKDVMFSFIDGYHNGIKK